MFALQSNIDGSGASYRFRPNTSGILAVNG
jgi:hypothetical protein